MKRTSIIMIAALVCAAVTACGGGKNVELTVWCSDMDREMITGMVEDFLAANPAARTVNVEVCEDDKARERFEEDPAAAADVICIPHDQLGALVAAGGLCEITGEKYIAAIESNTMPSVKAGQIGGKQYGFPSSFETHMLFYDKSFISDGDAETLEGILSSGVPENGFQFAMDFGNAYFSANWFFTYGCKLFGDSGEDSAYCDFDSAGGVDAMTYLIEHRAKFGDCTGDEAAEMFKERRLGAYVGGPWNAAAMTEALKGNYGCAMLPGVDGKAMKSFAGFKLYCVNANAENTAVSMDLAAWLTNPANQKARFQARNLIPVAISLTADVDVAVSTTAKAVMAQGPNSIAMPSIPEMSNFWEPAGELTLACYSGEIGVSELQANLTKLAAAIKGAE